MRTIFSPDSDSVYVELILKLIDYKVQATKPLSVDYKGKFRITSSSAPASGGVFLLALNILSNYPDISGPGTLMDSHRLIESLKVSDMPLVCDLLRNQITSFPVCLCPSYSPRRSQFYF